MAHSSREHSSLSLYLREIDQYGLLTREEEETLGRRVAQGDREARDQMIRCNLRLVVRIAREFMRRGVQLGDLVAEGNIGLMKAVERFDPEKGARFSTYATWWIRQSIRRAIEISAPTVRVPGYMVELISRWKRASEDLTARLNRPPTPQEMAEQLQMSPRRLAVVRRAMRASSASPQTSSDMMWLFEDVLVDEKAKAPEAQFLEERDQEMLRECLAAVDEREYELLRLRYGFDANEPMTLREIGAKLGVTRERVRQIESNALRKLARAISRYERGIRPRPDGAPAPDGPAAAGPGEQKRNGGKPSGPAEPHSKQEG